MNKIPFIPENAPFSPEQRLWLNGYLAGMFSDASMAESALAGLPSGPAAPAKPLVVFYGSQTGTAEGLAKKTSKEAVKRGFAPKLVDMAKYETVDLTKEENVLVITSTYGDGEPPDNAQAFWNYLQGEAAPPLAHLHYSVLALGDTNYSAFCQFGKNCDERLEKLGAKRVHPRVDCDVDYETPAKEWTEGVFAALSSSSDTPALTSGEADASTEEAPQGWSKKNPFPARLLANRLLNADGSGKEVRHYEISLAGSGLSYEVGDALGVMPANCGALVHDVLEALGCDGEEAVTTPEGTETSLRLALTQQYDITRPTPDLLKAAGERGAAGGELAALLDPARKDDLKKWLWGREIIDVIGGLTQPFAAAELTGLLKKLQPRLYSISSSPKAHPDEVHLTVAAVRYDGYGRNRKGVCSTFLADRCADNTPVPVFVQTSHGFRLPENGDVPVIMCGPGTGIAPFRAFLEERRATGAKGGNWLFFGDQKRSTDFLYQEQLEGWVSDGHLTRLDLAFSRDQAEKIYVQNRMLENAAELWSWLDSGAHFYVCGDASRMAKDVDAALHQVAETAGGLSKEAAAEFIQKLKSEKRYQRDVY
ncbi:sulfite reductase (NADPH) flavoprotein, alpha chain [Chthoniobacter flavus Ellin428]|uniref:assimilatory sulfite reductase (NADPH) n=1 Tax=Chthoniobacter flavus Ellin428 TaxID=497964 RepID=B4D7K3_9BACT|nr:sulfite reductase subunit alpha [Chthoniobacter flavus]EDY17620.1 sulfite reductase (NADPH) flavoprotein, alpha chain [Chthoniobacter flavus Ellin428]TCO92350.1 NAD(P)H-dependent nitrite reductase flavoprotein subunit [Chthoniobacter flavus]